MALDDRSLYGDLETGFNRVLLGANVLVKPCYQLDAKKSELAEYLSISVRTLSRIIQNLSSEPLSLIEYQGSKKTGGYVLTDKGVTFIEKGTNNIS